MPSYIRVHDKALPRIHKELGVLPVETESKIPEKYSSNNESNCIYINNCPYVGDPRYNHLCRRENMEHINCEMLPKVDKKPEVVEDADMVHISTKKSKKSLYDDESVDDLSNSGLINLLHVSDSSGISKISDSKISNGSGKKKKKKNHQ
jgi:hypothetical protein